MFFAPTAVFAPENTILGSLEDPILGVINIFLSEFAIFYPDDSLFIRYHIDHALH